jgi:hypothetical protein
MHMQIINMPLLECAQEYDVTTSIVIRNKHTNESRQLTTTLFTIEDETVGQYLPTKVWISPLSGVTLLYYVSASLPDQVRPFKDGKSYALVVPLTVDEVIEYDAEIRLLIDQVPTEHGLTYVFLFADDAYKKLIAWQLPVTSEQSELLV